VSLWLFLHLLGVAWWMGGGFSSLVVSIAARAEARPALATVMRLQWAIARYLVFPGSLLTVVSGLFLTMRLINTPGMGSGWLVTMQGLGMVGALLALTVLVPTAAKLSRLDPAGEHAAYFDRLRKRQWYTGEVAALLGLVALLSAAIYRYGG
jgi:uncharacterized membrane protein